MGEGLVIIPANAATTVTTTFGSIVTANALAILGVVALAVGVLFVMRWFRRSTNKLKG